MEIWGRTYRLAPRLHLSGRRSRFVLRRWRSWAPASAAVVLAAIGQPTLWLGGETHGPLSGLGIESLGAALVVLATAPLVLARRWPLPALAISAVAIFAYDAIGLPASPADLATLVLTAWVVVRCPPRRSAPAVGSVIIGAALVAEIRAATISIAAIVAEVLVVPASAVVGLAIRSYVARYVLERRESALAVAEARLEAERAAALERLRIAREVHDAVGHGVTVATLRAEAAARLIERDPARAAELLEEVAAAGRQAMRELHQLLGLLRDATTPPERPARDLAGVVRRFDGPGLRVRLDVEGPLEALPPPVAEVVAAVAAEGLANVVRHAHARTARVRLRVDQDETVLEVDDDGQGVTPDTVPGFGLSGAAERARSVGGVLSLDSAPGGGAQLRLRIPEGAATLVVPDRSADRRPRPLRSEPPSGPTSPLRPRSPRAVEESVIGGPPHQILSTTTTLGGESPPSDTSEQENSSGSWAEAVRVPSLPVSSAAERSHKPATGQPASENVISGGRQTISSSPHVSAPQSSSPKSSSPHSVSPHVPAAAVPPPPGVGDDG